MKLSRYPYTLGNRHVKLLVNNVVLVKQPQAMHYDGDIHGHVTC